MTSPEGQRHHGWWWIIKVAPLQRIEIEDGFGDQDGKPNPQLPVTLTSVVFTTLLDGGTRMAITTAFPSTEAMEQVMSMGMEEGMSLALGQIETILAEIP